VNSVTPHLFKRFPTAALLAKASPKEVETIIHSCGFYKTKTKAIIQTSKSLLEQFQGTVPETMEDLVSLSGVGRKTASVILNQAFDKPAIAVDTHVARVSFRLGWTKSKNPLIIERDLKLLLPESLWALVNGTLILHGRRICKARKPSCSKCRINASCPSAII
jgi:endonuclease-3